MLTLLNLKFQYGTLTRLPPAIGRRALSTSQLKEYYAILNVNNSSTPKEIRDSFLRLSKIYHPDNKTSGSHLKFVQLKEAYDALKDGPPATNTTSSYSSSSSTNSTTGNRYSNYDPYEDLSHRAYARYREQTKEYYSGRKKTFSSSFGGPYANSSTPWEDMRRDQEWSRKRHSGHFNQSRGSAFQPFIHTTLFLGAIAWIVIYSGAMLIFDYNNQIKSQAAAIRSRRFDEYLTLQESLKRKESDRIMNQRAIRAKKDEELRLEEEKKRARELELEREIIQLSKTPLYDTNKQEELSIDDVSFR